MNLLTATALALAMLAAPQSDKDRPQLPPGHPPMTPPTMPPGHPPVGGRDAEQPATPPEADAADVESIDAIVTAYYESISGPGGEPRQWGRFRSLFLPGAKLVMARVGEEMAAPVILSPMEYVRMNDRYFERGGYFEQEIHRVPARYGHIAHVMSTYASRRRADSDPYARGLNSIQLLNDGRRWWIASIMWQRETEENPLPEEYGGNRE